jgi:putative sigma-54 modulation protein
MKITYTGKESELLPKQQKKLDVKFGRVAKLLDRRGEKEAHVVLTAQRHLQKAEITVRYAGDSLVAFHAEPDVLSAVIGAVEKIEKQILRLQEKRRESRREPAVKKIVRDVGPALNGKAVKAAPVKKSAEAVKPARIYKVEQAERKPMTVDEAMLEMGGARDYLLYRDAQSNKMSVLVRRSDGHYDLIEY